MTSQPHGIGQNGFTLIEVLIAMVILAVGLLSLEALGIGASRATVRADRYTHFAMLASDSLEAKLGQLRSGAALADGTQAFLVGRDSMRIGISTAPAVTNPAGQVVRVRSLYVTVIPNASGGVRFSRAADTVRVSGNVLQ